MRIEHIAINVPEVEKHAQWYVNHLGMTIVRRIKNMNSHFIADEIRTTIAGDKLIFMRDPWGVCQQLAQRQKPLV